MSERVHDELCPVVYSGWMEDCQCDLIAKVRGEYVQHLQWERYLMQQRKHENEKYLIEDVNEMIRIAEGERG